MIFEPLFQLAEQIDGWIAGPLGAGPLAASLLVAAALGLRHAADPDHLVTVTSLVAAGRGDARAAARLGAWWGAGHAATLIALGVPLILAKSRLPGWLEQGAERAVGVVLLILAVRLIGKWLRGDYHAGRHRHSPARPHRHLRRGQSIDHPHDPRSPAQATAIGALHGLAGSGAVTLLLIGSLPGQIGATLALAAFASTSALSMALCSTAFAWALTRPSLAPVYRSTVIPSLGLLGLTLGAWYVQ